MSSDNVESRTDVRASTRLASLLEDTTLPGGNGVDFWPSSYGEYAGRLGDHRPHIAELFLENTKLHTHLRPLDVEARDLATAKAWYLETPYRLDEASVDPTLEHAVRIHPSHLPRQLGDLLRPFLKGGRLASLPYGVDIRLLYKSKLLRVVPNGDYLWIERRLEAEDETLIRQSLLRVPAARLGTMQALVFLAAAPWRYMIFLGPRGYRHMMFEAGALLSRLTDIASEAGLETTVTLDFYDAQIDGALLLDGVERTVLAVMALQGDAL